MIHAILMFLGWCAVVAIVINVFGFACYVVCSTLRFARAPELVVSLTPFTLLVLTIVLAVRGCAP
jgi:hypothetical protein